MFSNVVEDTQKQGKRNSFKARQHNYINRVEDAQC